jgi:hypothetical protein
VKPCSLVEVEEYISNFRRYGDKTHITRDISVSTFWLGDA